MEEWTSHEAGRLCTPESKETEIFIKKKKIKMGGGGESHSEENMEFVTACESDSWRRKT